MRRKGLFLLAVAIGLACAATPRQAAQDSPPASDRSHPERDAGWLANVQRSLAEREYEASANGEGLQAPNRAHDLRTYFEPVGIRVHDRTAPGSPELASLQLAGFGRGARLSALPPGEVSSEGARVEIRRPGLVEWYLNTAEGLEQGFTLAQSPGGVGPLVLELAIGPARAKSFGDTVIFETPAGRKLAYSKLVVSDAAGAHVAAHFEVSATDRVRLVVDDAEARYPLVIDPILTGASDTQLDSEQADSLFSYDVASAGDVNADGYADVIVGAYQYDAGQSNEGAAFLYLGSPTGIASATAAGAATRIESNQVDAYLGVSVAGAGDVNGDGYADVIIGSTYDDGEDAEGAAFIFLGSASGIANGNPTTAATRLQSNEVDASLGYSVASAGDVNGDGYADVIVGAPQFDGVIDNDPVNDGGVAFIFLGSAAGVANGTPASAATTLIGQQSGVDFGASVASAGDVNGDGYADVIVAAWHYSGGQSDESAAFIFHGSATGVSGAVASSAAARIESDEAGNGNISVASAGDVNGDGYSDVIVGLPNYGGAGDAGAAMVFHGSVTGIANGSPLAGGYASLISGDQAGAVLGAQVDSAGDVNGDGYSDVVISASRYDLPTVDEGVVFVLLGSAAGIASGAPATIANAILEVGQASALFGASVAGAGDVNGDGYSDVIAGAHYYGAGDEGAAFVFLGGAQGIRSGNPATAGAQLESNQTDADMGISVAGAGDVNGDGYADLIVGAASYDAGEAEEGAAFVFLGSSSGIANGNPTTAVAQLESNQADAVFGISVAGAGDVNGDGYADVIVGADGYNAGQNAEGAAFVFLGGASGVTNGNPATAAAQLESDQAFAGLGNSVAGAGDVNGDGYADVIVSAFYYNAGQTNEGAAFVFLGGASGIADGSPATAAAQLESDQENAYLGHVAGAGDVNGDGYGDVIVGASMYDSGETNEGAAFVFLGSSSGIADGSPATAAAQLESDQAEARLGWSVASAGDVNGDGYADVIVGANAYSAGQSTEGAAFVFLGSAAGVADGSPANAAAQLESDQASADMGWSVTSAGDVNGDGFADVIVGAYKYDSPDNEEGAAFVFLGSAAGIADGSPATSAAQLESDQANAWFGFSMASAGDVNGDGFADVIVGAKAYSAGDDFEGAAFVFYGGGNQTGRPVLARQLRGGGSATGVQAWGSSQHGDEFQVRMRATQPSGRGRVKLEIEACPPGVDFFGGGCVRRISSSWTDVTLAGGGVTLTETVSGLLGAKLYHWRARVLFAPFSVTQSGITSPPLPAHGPWRRLQGQAVEGDVRTLVDTDDDSITDAIDTDDDGDGLLDTVETDTGTYVSPSNTGSDPLDADSDDDGLLDGPEVALGTDPNDSDHDNDSICDGSGTGGGGCTAGPDNCPFISNGGQTNTDALSAGNLCQCGDVNNDGVVNATDVTRASESLVGGTLGGTFVPARCNVVGPNDAGPTVCDVGDLAILDRFARGQPASVQNACQAYLTP